MKKLNKQAVRQRRAAWNKALKEGRLVRHNDGQTITEYPTPEAARQIVNALQADGFAAEIVVVPEDWEE